METTTYHSDPWAAMPSFGRADLGARVRTHAVIPAYLHKNCQHNQTIGLALGLVEALVLGIVVNKVDL